MSRPAYQICRYERALKGVQASIADVNLKRSLQQGTAAKQLAELEEEWYAVSVKCVAIDGAVKGLDEQLAAIKARLYINT